MKAVLIKFAIIVLVSILAGYLVYGGLQKKQSPLIPSQHKTNANATANAEVTSLIQSITAPSLGTYGTPLLTDGIEADVNAWHAPEKPQYPVAIDVKFQKNVLIRQIGLQSQYGGPGNLVRAPKMVKIYGGDDFKHLKELGELTFEFQTAGAWTLRDSAKTKNKYQCFRIEILSNQGSPDFLTIQELKFYGEA